MFKRLTTNLSFLPFFYLFIFVGCICVTQDDYATLSELTSKGFLGPVEGVWGGLGGNISSVIPRSLALKLSVFPNFPAGLVLYSVLTLLLILSSFDHLLSKLINEYSEISLRQRLVFLAILGMGFEGIFTPGEIGVLGFSAAAGVHIWPVCLMVQLDKILSKRNFSIGLLTLIAVCYSTNANVPESALALLVFMALTYNNFLKNKFPSTRLEYFKVGFLALSAVISFATIFVAPGFSTRTKAVGVSLDPDSLILGVIRAFLILGADVLSHPFIYLALIAGMIFGKSQSFSISKVFVFRVSIMFFAYFLLLGVGAGIAYPAWHQTLGLFVILLPLSFSYGVSLSKSLKVNGSSLKRVFVPIVILCLIVTARSGYLVVERRISWSSHFQDNVCVVLQGQSEPFEGSGITYPPMNLGVEDLDVWPWMANGFSTWINGSHYSCRE